MKPRKRLAIIAGAVLTSTWIVTSATPAGASGPCGNGYGRVGVYKIPENGDRMGTLEVYYNSRTGKNCALAYGYGATYGSHAWKMVGISRSGATRYADQDSGNYTTYAGPVYVSARDTCINVNASIHFKNKFYKRSLTSAHCD
ncbi:hypothetical protein GCM10010404_38620 [Nonomuraea africana]